MFLFFSERNIILPNNPIGSLPKLFRDRVALVNNEILIEDLEDLAPRERSVHDDCDDEGSKDQRTKAKLLVVVVVVVVGRKRKGSFKGGVDLGTDGWKDGWLGGNAVQRGGQVDRQFGLWEER